MDEGEEGVSLVLDFVCVCVYFAFFPSSGSIILLCYKLCVLQITWFMYNLFSSATCMISFDPR